MSALRIPTLAESARADAIRRRRQARCDHTPRVAQTPSGRLVSTYENPATGEILATCTQRGCGAMVAVASVTPYAAREYARNLRRNAARLGGEASFEKKADAWDAYADRIAP